MKILVIEDERELSGNIKKYLEADNYLCEQVFNYNDATEKLMLYQYDCILLDLNLPDGDGMKLLDEIKRKDIRSGVIIISARDSLDDKIKGLKEGADDYLAKPFSLSELSIRVYALLRRQSFSSNNILKSNEVEIGDMADMFDNHNFVYAHIKNLKSKLGDAGCLNCIRTMYGTGYQWVE